MKSVEFVNDSLMAVLSKPGGTAQHGYIIEEARKQSARISQDSLAAANGLLGELRSQLYSELSNKVLDRAERLLRERLTGDDHARIRQEFSQQVERVQ